MHRKSAQQGWIMDNKAVKISENRAEANICTEWESIRKIYDETLAKYQKQITLPGFRKGKTPLNVLERKIGEDTLREACYEAMNNSMTELFEKTEADLRPLPYSTPEIVDHDKLLPFKKNKDINFTIRFDITPEVKLEKYKGLNVEIPNVTVSDEMVNKEIERYRQQNSIVKSKGADAVAAANDLVTVDYEATYPEGESDENKKIDDFTFTLGEKKNIYEFDDDIAGLKEGDEKEFTKNHNGKDVRIKVKVKSIKVKELPEVNDEFAQDIKSEYKTVADLKAGIKKQISDDLDERMKETKIVAVCDKILEDTQISVPKSMVDYEVELGFRRTAGQYNMSSKDFEKFITQIGQTKESFTNPWREDAEKSIKHRLVVGEVEKLENIKADEEKVKAILEKQTPADSDEETKKRIEESVRDQMNFSAAIDFLLENNNLKKSSKEITYEDYVSGKYLENSKEEEKGKGKDKADKKKAEDGGSIASETKAEAETKSDESADKASETKPAQAKVCKPRKKKEESDAE